MALLHSSGHRYLARPPLLDSSIGPCLFALVSGRNRYLGPDADSLVGGPNANRSHGRTGALCQHEHHVF